MRVVVVDLGEGEEGLEDEAVSPPPPLPTQVLCECDVCVCADGDENGEGNGGGGFERRGGFGNRSRGFGESQ